MMLSANDATQLAFCSRLERLNICSLHFESCSCGVTENPPELLGERRPRALSLAPTCYVAYRPAR